jgi:hypothetical protein
MLQTSIIFIATHIDQRFWQVIRDFSADADMSLRKTTLVAHVAQDFWRPMTLKAKKPHYFIFLAMMVLQVDGQSIVMDQAPGKNVKQNGASFGNIY